MQLYQKGVKLKDRNVNHKEEVVFLGGLSLFEPMAECLTGTLRRCWEGIVIV